MASSWYHQAGCRQWVVVQRNTATHQILTTEFARGRLPTETTETQAKKTKRNKPKA